MTQILSAIAKIRSSGVESEQSEVRKYFQKFNSPFYYISYADFCSNFQVHAGKNFKQQNLNIIDTHLKYRQWIYQEMAPYKWTPIIVYSLLRLVRLRSPPLVLPFIYTSLFDHYFHPFFAWLHKDDKIINIRYQFVTKLSKVQNKQRRLKIFRSLQKSLKREQQKTQGLPNKQFELPHKYIKFGFPSEYVFHATVDNVEMSTVLQTTFFQTYVNLRYPSLSSTKQFLSKLWGFKDKFLEYKKDGKRQEYFLDLHQFMKFKDIKQAQQYQLSTCIQKRVRRWLQTLMYERSNTIYYSSFTLDKILYFYEHKHFSEQPKYNIQQNAADLTIYYSLVLLPTILLKFFKR